MVAELIVRHPRVACADTGSPFEQGGIGVLDRTDMDHFADIFTAYQKRGKAEDPDGVFRSNSVLHRLNP